MASVEPGPANAMIVNPYCRNLGWLFEDLKAAFAECKLADVRPSDEPLPDADAWICIRTDECVASPDLARTVVQVHDFWERDYPPDIGALSIAHERCKVGFSSTTQDCECAVLNQPIGARQAFRLRGSMPERFTIGWCGRNTVRFGESVKRPHLLRGALAELRSSGVTVHCIALTPNAGLGPGVEYWHPGGSHGTPSLEQLQRFYESIDLLVVTSLPEPGPLSIFEALRCGVPVVSLGGCGGHGLPQHFEIGEHDLTDFLTGFGGIMRRACYNIRAETRAGMTWLQEDWIDANVKLAVELADSA